MDRGHIQINSIFFFFLIENFKFLLLLVLSQTDWANSLDPDEVLQTFASDQGLCFSPFIQFLDMSTGSEMDCFKIL